MLAPIQVFDNRVGTVTEEDLLPGMRLDPPVSLNSMWSLKKYICVSGCLCPEYRQTGICVYVTAASIRRWKNMTRTVYISERFGLQRFRGSDDPECTKDRDDS